MDDCWMENVGPLLTILEKLGMDPVEWACEPGSDVFKRLIPSSSEDNAAFVQCMRQIDFACGYLQATGNLTGMTWAEQIDFALAEEEKKNAKPEVSAYMPQAKFVLTVDIDTDDDVEILFEGDSYCLYGPKLVLRYPCNNSAEAIAYLKTITVVEGGKAYQLVSEFIGAFIDHLEQHPDEDDHQSVHSSNQEMDIHFWRRNEPVQP